MAQTTVPDNPTASPNQAIIFTPFEVSSEKDIGYVATETLAGTRKRASLRDAGASLTILTP